MSPSRPAAPALVIAMPPVPVPRSWRSPGTPCRRYGTPPKAALGLAGETAEGRAGGAEGEVRS